MLTEASTHLTGNGFGAFTAMPKRHCTFYQFFAYQGSNSNASAGRNYPCAISKELYDQIPATDVRKAIFLDPGNLPFNTATGLADKALTKKAKADYGSKLNAKSQIFAYMQFKMQAVVNPGVGEFCLFRAAEMYLTEAEADCHLGKEAEAQALLVALNKTSGRDPILHVHQNRQTIF